MTPLEELGPFGKSPDHGLYAHVRFTRKGDLVVASRAGLFLLVGQARAALRVGSGGQALVLSPTGTRCLTGNHWLVEGWDLASRTFMGEAVIASRAHVTGLAWVAEKNVCVVATGDGLATVDLRDFTRVRWLDRGAEHRQVVIDAARRHAITGCAHGVRAWPLDGGEPTLLEGHRGLVIAVDAAPRGALVASGGNDATVRLWDLEGRRQLASFEHHRGCVPAVAFHPRVQRLASGGSRDGHVALWDLPTRSLVRSFEAHAGGVSDLAWSRDGERLATAGQDGRVRVWAP